MIFTFDAKGISGHPNHTSLYKAALLLKSKSHQIYILKSYNTLKKFLSYFSLLFTKFKPDHLYFYNSSVADARKILSLHKSQYVWFRKLFISFSSYAVFNEWVLL